MKLCISLTFVFFLQISAIAYGQTVTLSAKNMPLEKVFKEVKKQTGYSFVYTRAQLTNSLPVTCNVVKATLKEVLSICFLHQPLTFVIEANYVVVQTKNAVPLPASVSDTLIEVRGHVTNENGEPLAGATVIAKYSSRGVSTNSKGDFILQGIRENDILIISNIGFNREELPVNNQRFFLINLKLAVNSLEETVVKGYYTTSRKFNTGSVVKINGSQITSQPVSNPILALEGLAPGLLITQSNGLPGSRFTALIRGQNSIQNGNSPLFVIDGVPFLSDNDALTQLNGMLANSPFNSIDPSDIESIEILKDADATAIYGSRGANGVILITTKKTKADKNSLSLNMYRGWGKVTRTAQMMNTPQYLEMRKEAYLNDGATPANYDAPDLVSWDQNRYNDWKKIFIGGTAQTYNAQLRYSGGNQFTRFSAGVGYYKETTVFPGSFDDKKTTADININHKSQDSKLNLNFITSYSYDKSMLPGQDLTGSINLPPNSYPLLDAAGKYIWREADYSVGNPLATLLQKNEVITDRLTANSIITYHPAKALEFKANFGYNRVSATEKNTAPIAAQDPAYAPTGSLALGDNAVRTWIIEPQASYKFNIKTKFRMEALMGSTWQNTIAERKLITGDGYTNDELLGSIAAAPYINATNSRAEYHYAAFFGRMGFDWDSKYILNLTGRRDASSRFGPGNRFANFGAVGVAWIFSKEPFIKNALPFLSFGKIRGSYGTTGNDQIGNYQYLDTYKGTIYAYQSQPGLTPARLFNSKYSWEENKKLEMAAELGFFEDRLTANFNYYKNKSGNQIIRYSLPSQTGFANILMNFPGVVQNTGYEISVNAAIIKNKNLQWNVVLNISHNKNTLVSFPGLANSSYASSYVIGKPLNAYRGLHFMGVDAQTGIYQFQDLNKDGIINNDDYDYIGTTDPKYFGGLSNSISYKAFQLNLLLEFRKQLGHDLVYSYSGLLGSLQNQPVYTLNRWRKPGDITPYQKFSQDYSGSAYLATNNVSQSDAILTDASYIRLKNIALSYTFPVAWLKPLQITSWKVYVQVQNLLTITRYKGNDPENQSLSSLPPLRMITAGTLVNF
ncbi:MAG: SusC/RagA family TonB-linked outer membrane protein [Bacteroidetes bacterium]|nr:SusC/RagA family TonB-linked outer membrane protein [Bacteroidota bacterium]